MYKKPRKIPPDKALLICQTMCAKQEFCVFDIERKLKRWQVEPGEIKNIIPKLQADKFIDENRYAAAYVNDKFRFSRWGRTKIKFNLKRKKVAEPAILKAFTNINQEDYLETLRKLIVLKKPKIKVPDKYSLQRKLVAYAIGRGFEPELVFKIINENFK